MRYLPLLLLCHFLQAFAFEGFSAEEQIDKPDKIPPSIISALQKKIDLNQSGCLEEKLSDALEAKKINIGTHANAMIVKPKSWCLCGAYYCPMWLFETQGNRAKQIWFTSGTSGVDFSNKKVNGYRQIEEGGATAGHGGKSTWTWDGNKYRETYRETWGWDDKNNCRDTETYRFIHGKLKKVSVACISDSD